VARQATSGRGVVWLCYILALINRGSFNSGLNYLDAAHWCDLERVLQYLKGTMTYDIHYNRNPKVLEGYCDANWISDIDELYATSGYVFLFGGGAVFWKSCKLTILANSTIEAELTT
jgi:hypothetical protein